MKASVTKEQLIDALQDAITTHDALVMVHVGRLPLYQTAYNTMYPKILAAKALMDEARLEVNDEAPLPDIDEPIESQGGNPWKRQHEYVPHPVPGGNCRFMVVQNETCKKSYSDPVHKEPLS